jgi:hypothetical protein
MSDWNELSVISDRLGALKAQGNAAVAAGDTDAAAYFFRLAKQAEAERELVLARLIDVLGDRRIKPRTA